MEMVRETQVLHVRFGGRSQDVPLGALNLSAGASDAEIKRHVAEYLEIDWRQLDASVIDRHANGNLTLRPEAVFG